MRVISGEICSCGPESVQSPGTRITSSSSCGGGGTFTKGNLSPACEAERGRVESFSCICSLLIAFAQNNPHVPRRHIPGPLRRRWQSSRVGRAGKAGPGPEGGQDLCCPCSPPGQKPPDAEKGGSHRGEEGPGGWRLDQDTRPGGREPDERARNQS